MRKRASGDTAVLIYDETIGCLIAKDLRLLNAIWNCLRISLVRKLFFVVLFMLFNGSRIIKFEVELVVDAPNPPVAIEASPPGLIKKRSMGCCT